MKEDISKPHDYRTCEAHKGQCCLCFLKTKDAIHAVSNRDAAMNTLRSVQHQLTRGEASDLLEMGLGEIRNPKNATLVLDALRDLKWCADQLTAAVKDA